jgi:hypothetical protein
VVEVNLADTLITNYGYILPFSQKMGGTAEIITEDLPLIVRLFNPLKAILKKHLGNPNTRNLHSAPGSRERREPGILKRDLSERGNPYHAEANKKNIEKKSEIPRAEPSISPVYHIIAGSFLDSDKAEKELLVFQKRGYSCQIILNNDRFRLSIYSETDKIASFEALESIREKEANESIWLLKVF